LDSFGGRCEGYGNCTWSPGNSYRMGAGESCYGGKEIEFGNSRATEG